MKRILYIATVLAAGLLTACNKERMPERTKDSDLCEVSIRLKEEPMRALRTKADAIGSGDTADLIDRLDVFVYSNKDTLLFDHKAYTNASGLDLSCVEDIKYYDVGGTAFYFFILTNLDEVTANYFATLSRTRICTYYGGLIPLEAGNFRKNRPIMGGTGYAQLGNQSYYSSGSGDKTVTITLFRYIARFEIEKITADFDDEDLMNSDVFVKSISWANVANALRPLRGFPSWSTGDDVSCIWGGRSTYNKENEFGNLDYESGYRYYEVNENHHGWVSLQESFNPSGWGATGALATDFPYIYNNNYQLNKGVLNIDAPGDMRDATYHAFSGETGRICSSTNASQTHVLNVNREFYIYPICRNSYSTYMCTSFNGQDDTIKLVIEVEINGKTYFYPYRAMYLQPNSRYLVRNITLKGIGSDYSNFYIKKYGADLVPVSIQGWDELEVNNIDMGYSDYDGNNIY